jgi:hypothetical protein
MNMRKHRLIADVESEGREVWGEMQVHKKAPWDTGAFYISYEALRGRESNSRPIGYEPIGLPLPYRTEQSYESPLK